MSKIFIILGINVILEGFLFYFNPIIFITGNIFGIGILLIFYGIFEDRIDNFLLKGEKRKKKKCATH